MDKGMRTIVTTALFWAGFNFAAVAADSVATTDSEQPGISLQVRELKVGNGTTMLRFTILNDSDSPFDPDSLADKDGKQRDYHSISGIYLLDAANKKKYLVMYDSANLCVCSRESHNIAAKSSSNLWAKFSAPPENVQKIGLVIPHFIPMDDVPLSR